MGYLSLFPPETVGGFSSGLGFSLASALCILFNATDLTVLQEFFILSPASVLYFIVFFFWLQKPTPKDTRPEEMQDSAADSQVKDESLSGDASEAIESGEGAGEEGNSENEDGQLAGTPTPRSVHVDTDNGNTSASQDAPAFASFLRKSHFIDLLYTQPESRG